AGRPPATERQRPRAPLGAAASRAAPLAATRRRTCSSGVRRSRPLFLGVTCRSGTGLPAVGRRNAGWHPRIGPPWCPGHRRESAADIGGLVAASGERSAGGVTRHLDTRVI